MKIDWPWGLSRDINHLDSVDVRMNGLVTNNQLLQLCLIASQHCNICVCYIQFILEFQEEIKVIWIELTEPDDENSKLLLVFVCKDIDHMIISVIYYLFNGAYLIEVIKVYEFLRPMVIEDTVF